MSATFQIGQTYSTRSIADYDTIHTFKIIARTTKTVTVNVHGKVVKRGLTTYEGVEQFKPFGTYSTIISADKVAS